MTEKCKNCCKEFDSGIWVSSQFKEQRILLFCSEKCQNEFVKKKLERIKVEYPKYYDKIIKSPEGIDFKKVL
jgi:ribosomal protein L24E